MDFICALCGAGFYYKRYLTNHHRRMHNIQLRIKTKELACPYCDKRFSAKSSLFKHKAKIHNIKTLTIECKEENCDEKFRTVIKLREHLRDTHGMENMGNYQNMNFEKLEDFNVWLEEEERNSNSKFVISAKSSFNNIKYITYSCNRSGVFKSKVEKRNRRLKAQGTRKIGFHCTSFVRVKEVNNIISVTYFKEHYKHEHELCHIPIPDSEKRIIVAKLIQGIDRKEILQDAKQSLETATSIKRQHLITRRDIQNIERDFGLILPSQESVLPDEEANVLEATKFEMKSIFETFNNVVSVDESILLQIRDHVNSIRQLVPIEPENNMVFEIECPNVSNLVEIECQSVSNLVEIESQSVSNLVEIECQIISDQAS